MIDISSIQNFLACPTPPSWCAEVPKHLSTLLIDHAHCEKKAASTAISLLFRYPEKMDLVHSLSRLAREELRHFEQVIAILKKREIPFKHLPPAKYAEGLHQIVSKHEPERLIDILIMCAFIEARSCERFYSVIPYLDSALAEFYEGLLHSESRHYQMYIEFAEQFADFDLKERIAIFREKEKELILSEDALFRFHSGCPVLERG